MVPGTLKAQSLDSARAALAKYRDPVAAIGDGYLSTVACMDYPQGGTLGDHKFAPGPSIFGTPFEGPMHGHKPLMPEALHHWDLHVWLWTDNPAGRFSSTNANVRCPAGRYTFRDDKPSLVHPH